MASLFVTGVILRDKPEGARLVCAAMSHLELTRDLLMDAGGWQEMKKARSIHREGGVKSAKYKEGFLSGEIRIGGKMKKISMEIISRSHMENKCTCLMVRRDGRVCAHIIAIGLEVIDPQQSAAPVASAKPVEDKWPTLSEEGKEATLQVMLPLKVEPAWERGQLMVGFGAVVDGEETLLSALTESYRLEAHDEELWRVLRELFPGEAPGVVNLDRPQFLDLLEGLIGHPRIHFGKKTDVTISAQGPRLPLRMVGERIALRWPAGVNPLGSWILEKNDFSPVALGLPSKYTAVLEKGLRVSAGDAQFVIGQLERWFEVPERIWDALPHEGIPEVLIHLEGSLRHLEARLEFRYEDQRASCIDGEAQLVGDTGLLTSVSKENAVIEFFRSWNFEGPAKGGRMALREREEILKFHAFAELLPLWQVEKGERFEAAAKQVVAVRPDWDVQQGSGQDWFTVETRFQVGNDELGRDQVQRMLRMGSSEQAYGRGKIAVIDSGFIDEVNDTLSDCDPTQAAPGIFEVSTQQAAYLRQSARDFGMSLEPEESVEMQALPDVLRPYQADGVRWMWKLSELKMGGILADDMGLGKTIQTLTFIQARGGRALVVCPSSLVFNWAAEAQKWFPDLKVALHVGSKRGELPQVDLVITSYAILRIDSEKFNAAEFDIAVLDEAQQIKNPEAQVSKAVHALKARHRFALSGTPVENSLLDLWSIMHFALPGYLGPRKAFIERFEKPLRKGGDSALGRRLARRLKPVVLRRLKTEVAKDLPARIEQVRYCDLTPKQSGIYRQLLVESRSQVDAADDGKKRMVALTALLRLRQACCDLRLLPGIKVEDKDAGIKLDELESLLEEAVAGGHRVLVFSQFVQLLQGLVPMLLGKGWDYCYLDGQTRKRGEVVERFQEGKAPVFLISLKAGGVGLNLTAADTVIHLDPWWNPAVEAQATDRAHRIGQTRVVNSYKFITRGTVEEKILALQEEKKAMMESVLDGGSALVPGLEENELMGLFG
ncbi:MAG: DEAD/DEAH box helicase [Akkermansiaceae bacterium]|jgi:superfamily II DNA or RNA helicase|tara:strand:- start:715 stop:3720 length:3006 start_codon:yes stop_codon:yes gene_type:complete